jgi:hypothetical protein
MFHGLRYNFDLRPGDWVDHWARKGYSYHDEPPVPGAHPVLIIIILRRPLKEIFLFGDYPRNLGPHPIIYEHRPEATGYSLKSGDYIGATYAGTLGGFLWHKNDLTYHGLSCAHVLGDVSSAVKANRAYSPKPNVFGAKTEIGNVTWSEMPPSPSTTKCNSRTDPNAPTIDAAFAELDANIIPTLAFPGAGKIAQWTLVANMGQGDPGSFSGYSSGTVQAKIKEATIWKELTINGSAYCFKDIFVLEDSVFHYIASSLAQPGDSGAWIINTTAGVVTWDGMLIGGDGQLAYCCYAENIMAALPDKDILLPP